MSFSIMVTHDDTSVLEIAVDRTLLHNINAAFIAGGLDMAGFSAIIEDSPISPISTIDITNEKTTVVTSFAAVDDQPTFDAKFAVFDGGLYNILKKGFVPVII